MKELTDDELKELKIDIESKSGHTCEKEEIIIINGNILIISNLLSKLCFLN